TTASAVNGTTATLSSSDTPGNALFITINSGNYDWRSPQNDNLWQGVSGVNNPCPSGYRLPTEAEWIAESGTWGSSNLAGAFGSVLKLPAAGGRNGTTGALYQVGTNGSYWSSSINGTGSRGPGIEAGMAYYTTPRAFGLSVRCIKN
ncbi:MAG TPA: hypothetical protein DCR46_01220, partial [Cytophagales bacterium]|nr:hypothetical protein [Cytophagales bacterium]